MKRKRLSLLFPFILAGCFGGRTGLDVPPSVSVHYTSRSTSPAFYTDSGQPVSDLVYTPWPFKENLNSDTAPIELRFDASGGEGTVGETIVNNYAKIDISFTCAYPGVTHLTTTDSYYGPHRHTFEAEDPLAARESSLTINFTAEELWRLYCATPPEWSSASGQYGRITEVSARYYMRAQTDRGWIGEKSGDFTFSNDVEIDLTR